MSHGIQIGKVAEQTNLSIDTIRFYQKIGLVRQPARNFWPRTQIICAGIFIRRRKLVSTD